MLIPDKFSGYAHGRRRYHLDLGADAPDTSRQDAVAEKMAAMSEDQWNWVKQQYEAAAPDRAAAADTARQVSGQQLRAMTLQNSLTEDYANYQKNTFRPLEEGIVSEAQNYDTAARREQAAGEAMADVQVQLDAAQGQQQRNLTRMGVAPNSGKMLSLSNQTALAGAAAKAGAANTARKNVELQGYARKMDAANLGRNLASNQATSAGVALNQGNSAVSNANVPNTVTNQGIGVMNSSLGAAQQGLGSAASIWTNSSNMQAQADASGAQALGSLAGAGLMAYGMKTSDKNQKTDRKPVKPEISLSAIRKLPDSESWRYREDSPAADGGKVHVGPMAQDIRASLGDGVAPGGKAVDLISMNGHLTNAVKALDKKVIRLENFIKKG